MGQFQQVLSMLCLVSEVCLFVTSVVYASLRQQICSSAMQL